MFVFGKKVAGAEQSLKCVKFKLVKLVTNKLVKLFTNKLMALYISGSRDPHIEKFGQVFRIRILDFD